MTKDRDGSTKPMTLIVFGATGDLMSRKIVPALYHLFENKRLPTDFSVVGVARREIDDEGFRGLVTESVTRHLDVEGVKLDDFTEHFFYQRGNFESAEDYDSLGARLNEFDDNWKTCANRLFYLAVPPRLYRTILELLSSSGLTGKCSPDEAWTRILVEKPFGKEMAEARSLDALLGELFEEEQIYRIDHYLAKEVLQNILMFRFANNLLEGVWSNKYIESINIRLLEKIGVEGRGSFYEGVGALLDVGQNHLMQMMAFVAMNHPIVLSPDTISREKGAVLGKIQPLSDSDLKENTFRGQYQGYLEESGVESKSTTETYFKIKAYIDSARWEGVPVLLEGGKKMPEDLKEIVVTFKHPAPCICPVGQGHFKNVVKFRIEPDPGITIKFWSKKPGHTMELEERRLDFKYEDMGARHYMEDYSKVLLDCISGDQTIFSSSEESRAGWNFIDPIVTAWREDAVPLVKYAQNQEIFEKSDSVDVDTAESELKLEIGVVGLGKMGGNIALQLIDKGWSVVGYNRSPETTEKMEGAGLRGAYSLKEVVEKLEKPRVIWVMVPAGKPLDAVLFGEEGLVNYLDEGDIIIDGGNSFFKDTKERASKLKALGIKFIDAGVSGGPVGARDGACLMVGGDRETFEHLIRLFTDMSVNEGVQFFDGPGAGHFVKMVHNGIEYGMMQSIAEGFSVLEESDYNVDLIRVADIYNHGSVIEARLMGWLKRAFVADGTDLAEVSGVVGHTGEAEWTVKTAKELNVKTPVIEESLATRVDSAEHPSYTGKILTVIRDQFGGHGKGKKSK